MAEGSVERVDARSDVVARSLPIESEPSDEAVSLRDHAGAGGLTPPLPPDVRRSAGHVLHLQRTRGNSYVQRLLAPSSVTSRVLQRDGPTAEEFEWEQKRNKTYRIIDTAGDQFEDNKTAWEIYARSVGTAYSTAYRRHEDAVNASARVNALNLSVVMSVFSAIATGMSGGMGEALTSIPKIGAKTAGMLEDALQAAVGKSFDVATAALSPSAQKVNLAPLEYQNSIENAVSAAWRQVKQTIVKAKTQLDSWELSEFNDIDPPSVKTVLDGWLKSNPLMKQPPAVDEASLADKIERGIWANWLPTLKVTEKPGDGPFIFFESTYFKAPGTPVEERLEALGVVPKGHFGWWTSDEDMEEALTAAEGIRSQIAADEAAAQVSVDGGNVP